MVSEKGGAGEVGCYQEKWDVSRRSRMLAGEVGAGAAVRRAGVGTPGSHQSPATPAGDTLLYTNKQYSHHATKKHIQ